ncbi:MAG: FtsX-like permease family protein [Actinomycetota bacterium]
MATIRFLLRRFAAQRLLGVAVVVTLAFSVGVLVAGPIYADAAREAILSSAIEGAGVSVGNARFSVYGDAVFDWSAADAAVGAQANDLPVGDVVSQAQATVRLGDTLQSVPLLFRDGAFGHLPYDGTVPADGEAAIAAGAARTLHLRAGDTLKILGPTDEPITLRISATYDTPAPGDPFWFGARNPFPAPDTEDPPPVIVDRATMAGAVSGLGLSTEFSWDVYLQMRDLPYEEATTVPGRLAAMAGSLRSEGSLAQVRLATGLDTLLRLVDQRVENLRIPILLVVFQIGAVTLAVLAGVGALTLTRQTFELAVLHSRGFSRRTLLLAQSVQALISAAIAFPIGLGIGLLLARLAGRSNGPTLPGVLFPVRLTQVALMLGVGTAAVGALILILLSVPVVSRTVLEERRAASREERPLLARIPVELFVIPLGLFAYLQLRGGTKPDPGSGTIDPLVLAAPTLLLFGASFLALRLLLFVLRRLDRRIGRARSLPRYLAGRRLERAPGTGFAAALLLLLAMGLLVVSTSYRAIVLTNHIDSAHTQIGGDWNVTVTPPVQTIAAIRALPATMTPVVRTEPSLSGGAFSLPPTALGIDPASYLAGGWWRGDFSDSDIETILADLGDDALGSKLPPDAATLTVDLTVPRDASGLALQATTIGPDGAIVASDPAPLDLGSGAYDLPLAGADRLLSITLRAETTLDLPYDLSIDVDGATIDGAAVPISSWAPLTWRGSNGTLTAEGDGVRYDFSPGAGNVVGGLVPTAEPLPALVSESVAAALGRSFTVTMAGQQIELRVVATATQFPSVVPNAPFIVVSAPSLLERQFAIPEAGLTLSEVWANGPDDPSGALKDLGFFTGEVQATAPIEGVLAQLPQSLAVGMNFTAAAGGLGLVVIGVAAGLYFAQRRRDYEFAALRAMGTEARQIRRTLILEQSGLLGFALVAGFAIGVGLLRLVMPYVGTSLGVSFPPPVLVIDWTALGVSVAAIVVTTGLSLAASMRVLMRSSVTGVLRGEAE